MPQFHSIRPSENNRSRLPKKHNNGGLLKRYGGGGLLSRYGSSRLPDKMVIDTNIVASTVEEDVRGKQNRRYGTPAMPIEPETVPLSVVVAESASESASRSLQVQPQLQSDKRYFSLFIPLRYGWSGGGRAPLVIPGSKSRFRKTDELYLQGGRLPSSLRLGLLVISTFCIFLICMLTMTPLAGSFNGDTASQQVVMVPKYALDILPRDSANGGMGGSSTWTDPGVASVAYYKELAQEDAIKWGIPPNLYVAQIQQESHFDPNATSPAGALGIAQFEPSTAAEYHFDPLNPVQALDGGAHFMSDLYNEFDGDYAKALAGYNAGSGAVDNAVAGCNAYWLSCMNTETQSYVDIIMYGG
jgi:hypothetical protein